MGNVLYLKCIAYPNTTRSITIVPELFVFLEWTPHRTFHGPSARGGLRSTTVGIGATDALEQKRYVLGATGLRVDMDNVSGSGSGSASVSVSVSGSGSGSAPASGSGSVSASRSGL